MSALRRRRATRLGVVAASRVAIPVSLMSLMSLVSLTSCVGREFDPSARRAPPTTWRTGPRRPVPANAPLAEAASPVGIWLSAQLLPAGMGDLAVAVRNDAPDVSRTYGLGGSVEWWNGEQWRDARPMSTCLESWPCVGQVEDPATDHPVPSVRLTAPPGGFGPVETLDVSSLDPGWYRVVKRIGDEGSTTAVAQLEVTEVSELSGSPAPPPLPRGPDHRLAVTPTIMASAKGEVVRVQTVLNGGDRGSAEDLERLEPSLSASAEIVRWDGSAWVGVATVQLERGSSDAGGSVLPRVALPPLPAGSYRLLRRLTGGRELPGMFFVR